MSARKKSVIRKEVAELLEQDVIERAPNDTLFYENHVFGIVKPNDKLRMILDMKRLNTYMKLPKLNIFKLPLCFASCWSCSHACKIDLSNAFWHIGVHEDSSRFLSFSFIILDMFGKLCHLDQGLPPIYFVN